MDLIYLIGGLLILISGGELLVRGAVRIAYKLHISTLVVGMTIVSFGTSAPELLVSIEAANSGHPQFAIGNVIGSNIANIALILGIAAIIFPIRVDKNSLRVDWPMMMASTVLVYLFMLRSNSIVYWQGIIMIALLLLFSYLIIWKSRSENRKVARKKVKKATIKSYAMDVALIVLGSLGLSMGSNILVTGATGIAAEFGISDFVISVTIIAFGTSLPELITALVAAVRRQADISVGNLIGSNIFNLLGILGASSMVSEIPIGNTILFNDMIWMIGVSFLILPFMISGRRINRLEGLVLLLVYLAYMFMIYQQNLK
jgi:cation:H+ antiporter